MGFVEWFSVWLREAPSAEVIEESILINIALFNLFNNVMESVDNA